MSTIFLRYSLRPILLFADTDVSTTKICLDTSVLAKSNMGRREYCCSFFLLKFVSKYVCKLLICSEYHAL
jgi:hypothetical protein